MAQVTVVLEGSLKFREGKKWKPRWCLIRKLSPAADRLHISLYKSARDRYRNAQEKSNIPVENFYGIDSSFQLDKERHVMAIVCQQDTILLAFQNKETLFTWAIAVRTHLGEEEQFQQLELIKAPQHSKLRGESVTIFIQGNKFCLSSGCPPKILASWLLCDIRKFGTIEGKFCFQAGNQCKTLAGVFAFASDKSDSITRALQAASDQAKRCRSQRTSASSSRHNSRPDLCSSRHTVRNFNTASLPRDFRKKDFGNPEVYADQNFITESGKPVARRATASAADYKVPPAGKPRRAKEITQSTPNFPRKFENPTQLQETKITIQNKSDDLKDLEAKIILEIQSEKKENLKSRRYSSGDLYLSKVRQTIITKQKIFGVTSSVWHASDSFCKPTEALRSQSEVDITDFYAKFQKSLTVLAPKLHQHDEWKNHETEVKSASTHVLKQNCSSHLDLESHGHGGGYTSNSSLNLSEILQTCSLSEEKLSTTDVSTKNSGTGWTRDLGDTPVVLCTIGSVSDVREVVSPANSYHCIHESCGGSRTGITCNKCRTKAKRSKSAINISNNHSTIGETRIHRHITHSSSLSQLNNCSNKTVSTVITMKQDGGVKTIPVTGSGVPGNGNRGTPYVVGQSTEHCTDNRLSNGHTSPDVNPHCPLQYVDLTRFDGEDGGYLHCLKPDMSASRQNTMQTVNLRHSTEYQNVPLSHHKPASTDNHAVKRSNGQTHGSQTIMQPTNNFQSIHGSLQRPQGRGVIQVYGEWESGTCQTANFGDYIRLKDGENKCKNSIPPRPSRKPKSGSLENILERNDQTTSADKLLCDSITKMQNEPGSDIFAVVPARLASFSKEDLLGALARQTSKEGKAEHKSLSNLHDSSDGENPGRRLNRTESLHTANQPCATREAEYIDMAGSAEDNSVFCTVELPSKRSNSFSMAARNEYCNMSLDRGSKTSVTQGDDSYLDMSLAPTCLRHATTDPAYLDMSYGQKRSSSMSVRSSTPVKDSGSQYRSHNKPMLHHSKSLDNELDGPYLDMHYVNRQASAEYLLMNQRTTVGRTDTGTDMNDRQASAEYLLMNQRNTVNRPNVGLDSTTAVYANTSPLKPFENLIKHKCYNKAKDSDETSSGSNSVKTGDNNSVSGDKSSSEDDINSQKNGKGSKKSKSSSFLSRFKKINSVKFKDKDKDKEKTKLKQSRSTQEFSAMVPKDSSSQDRRLSMQTPAQSSSASFPKFTIGQPQTDNLSTSASNIAASTSSSPTGSPKDSGLVSLSQWRLGVGVGLAPNQRPLLPQDVCQANNLRYPSSKEDKNHHYVNGSVCMPNPPALPPKTYKGKQQVKSGVPSPSHLEVMSRLRSDEQSPSNGNQDEPYMEMSLGAHGSAQGSPRTAGDVLSNYSQPPNKSDSSDSHPPPLPDKKGSRKTLSTVIEHHVCEQTMQHEHLNKSGTSGTDPEDDDVFLDLVPPPVKGKTDSRHGTMLPPGESSGRPRKNPNLIVAIPGTPGECSQHYQGSEKLTADVWQHGEGVSDLVHSAHSRSGCNAIPRVVEERHARCHNTGSTRSTASSSSCDSNCDTHSQYYDDSQQPVPSPGVSVMRPRFGKEYKRIDKRRLAEELNMPLPGQSSLSHSTEPSPSVASSVFNFDLSAIKSRQSSTCSAHSACGEVSPKYPPSMTSSTRHSRDPAYVNLSFSRTSSPVILESTPPPQSPGGRSNLSENSDVLLNYAEIDLSDSGKGKKISRPIPKKGTVDYAVIDMVATAAISQVGREHAQSREAKLRKGYDSYSRFSNISGSHSDKHMGSVTLPTPGREKRTSLGRSNSTSSRDRKF